MSEFIKVGNQYINLDKVTAANFNPAAKLQRHDWGVWFVDSYDKDAPEFTGAHLRLHFAVPNDEVNTAYVDLFDAEAVAVNEYLYRNSQEIIVG